MATKFSIDNILVAREDANGDIVPNPTVMQLCVTEDTLKEVREYTDIKCVLQEGSMKKESGSSVEGGFKIPKEANTLSFVMSHTLGEKQSVANATTDLWTTATAYQRGDMVNVAGGYTLIALKIAGAGLTSATQPIPTKKGEIILDNEVTWEAQPTMLSIVYPLSIAVPKFTAEITLVDGAGVKWRKQYRNLEFSQLPFEIKEDADYEDSLDMIGGVGVDEDSPYWTTDLLSIAGMKFVKAETAFLGGACELTTLHINDVVDLTDSVELSVDKGLSYKQAPNCRSIVDRDLKAEGSLTKDFTIEDYENFKVQKSFDVKAKISTYGGASCAYHFPKVVPQFADPDRESKTMVYITSNINAESGDEPLVTITVVVPSIIDDATGNIIGDGTW